MYQYKVKVIRVVDGDTIVVDVDLGFDVWVRNITLRLDRIDAYETRLTKGTTQEMKDKGILAKSFVQSSVDAYPDNITITTTGRGKYGRWIAEVAIDGEHVSNLSDALVSMGYAIYRTY